MKEREAQIRDEYDQVLTSKLAGMLKSKPVNILMIENNDNVKVKSRNDYKSINWNNFFFPFNFTEQYDTFVKFTYDQIQKRFENGSTITYIS